MLSEEFDKRLREAAEQHHPAYDESAWSKMKHLLDVHMPVEKDNRRRFVFFLLFLIIGIAVTFMLVDQPWETKIATITPENNKTVGNNKTADQTSVTNDEKSVTVTGGSVKGNNVSNTLILKKESNNNVVISSGSSTSNINKGTSFIIPASKKKVEKTGKLSPDEEFIVNDFQKRSDEGNSTDKNENKTVVEEVNPPAIVTEREDSNQKFTPAAKETAEKITEQKNVDKTGEVETPSEETPTPEETVKVEKSNPGKLFITASVGPDISKVGQSAWGDTKIQYGVGVGYSLTKKIALRTGFYVSDKIYTASGDEYHPKKPGYYDKLLSVDANCKIFEIPVTVVYRFYQRPTFQLFAAAGVASVIMKTEDYGYHYTDLYGQYGFHEYYYKNQNRHLFSTASISAGLDYKITKRFALLAEPYFKLPLSGVGEGSVNLKSAGIMFSGKFSLGNSR